MNKNTDLDNHIFHIVQNTDIGEQADLQKYLRQKGYNIPQATLSRRLKKLKIAKIGNKYEIVSHSQLQPLPRVLGMKISDFGIIILHTHPGNANSLAFFLDQKYVSVLSKDSEISPISGTIAGDDTVLIVAKNKNSIKNITSILRDHFPYLDVFDQVFT